MRRSIPQLMVLVVGALLFGSCGGDAPSVVETVQGDPDRVEPSDPPPPPPGDPAWSHDIGGEGGPSRDGR